MCFFMGSARRDSPRRECEGRGNGTHAAAPPVRVESAAG